MTEILSLWRSALDRVALSAADRLCDRQPRCSINYETDFHATTIYNFGVWRGHSNVRRQGNQLYAR